MVITARALAIRDEAHWLAMRRQHVSGSEVAAVLGCHPQLTRLELWHAKKGSLILPDKLSGDERVAWGKRLEATVAAGVAEDTGWKLKKSRRYLSAMPDIPLGGTPDYLATCPDRGPGIVEIKTADWLVFSKWDPEEGVPLNYQIQLQTYLALTERSWGAIAVLVGGNRLEIFPYERRESLIDLIVEEVEKFWTSIERDEPPDPDFERDHALVGLLYKAVQPGTVVEFDDDDRILELAVTYMEAARVATEADKMQKAAKAELLSRMGSAQVGLVPGYKISTTAVNAQPDWHITLGDVGRIIKGRAGYRMMRVTATNR